MKRFALAALAAALVSGSVYAADLPGSLKDEPFERVRHADFAGLYVGVGAGGEFANYDAGGVFDGKGADGIVGDAVIGWDFRRASFVIGPRIQGGISNVNTEIAGSDLVNLDAYINLGARAGVVFNRTLVYAHGGYEFMWASSDIPAFDAALDDADLRALTVGLGVETAISDNLSIAAEGAYISGLDDAEDLEAFRGLVRLNWRR